LASCIFDPADRVLGLKVQLFLLCWFLTIVLEATRRRAHGIHVDLLLYMLLFMLVPVLSVAWYWFVDGGVPFEGLQLLKGYVLVTFAVLLYIRRIDLLPHLAGVLTILAVAVIAVFLALWFEPVLRAPLYLFGQSTGAVVLDDRDFGSGLVVLQVYFVTSPMLAISIAYFYNLARTGRTARNKLLFGALMATSAVAMFLSGTRTNILASIALPLVLFLYHSKSKGITGVAFVAIVATLAMIFAGELSVFFDPSELSNNMKLSLLDDYRELFNDPVTLLLGQGLGAYHYWSPRGSYFYVSELTYLELVRNFGVLGSLVMLTLLVFPALYAFGINRSYPKKHIVIGYAFYLLMCASNPNLFSSMGILILAIVLADIFRYDTDFRRQNRRGEI
jgi:hypothetical protein